MEPEISRKPAMQNPTREELLYLADQEPHGRGMMQSDNYGDFRASLVKEWALREAASRVPDSNGDSDAARLPK